MSNVENTIGIGLSKIQDGLDKSKNKLELIKEMSKLNKIIDDVSAKKAEALLELGIYTYEKIRNGILDDDDLTDKCQGIIGFDHIIYENKLKLEDLKKMNEGFTCSCGNHLNYDDKFCGSCGKKIEIPIDNSEYIVCNRCETNIKKNSIFCPCCGIKLPQTLKSSIVLEK